VIQITVTANEVINHQPGKRKNGNANIKPGANYKGFVNDILSCKIKTYPGKDGCHAIAKGIPANMYSGLVQKNKVLISVK
jgi:hypothetical protein